MSGKFDIYHEFKVAKRHQICGSDLESLARLYLPLIGLDAFGLYHFLLTLPEDKFFTHKLIYDSLGLVDQRIINSAREKLEAVGLIETYINNSGKIMYVLYRPLSVEEFSADVILSNALTSVIGEISFEQIINQSKVSLRGFQNISKKFNEVFTMDSEEDVLHKVVKTRLTRGVQFDNSFFDYLIFKEILGTSLIDEELLEDEEFREHIYRISYIYQLNEEEMKEAVILTIELDKDFNYDCLSKNAKKIYQSKNINKTLVHKTTTNDAFVKSTGDSTCDQVIHYFDTMHPKDLLKELSGINPSVSEIEMVNELIKNTNFPIGVINVMISMVNTEKQGVLPGYNYFEKIANTWARAGIRTTQDAINYIVEQREKFDSSKQTTPKTQSKRTTKRTAKAPDWYDEYEQNIQNYTKNKQENLSESEKQKIIEEAKKLLS